MISKITLGTIFLFIALTSFGQFQERYQYFDGNDTIANRTLTIVIDSSASNVWQIGPPQKTLFDNAATAPNVIVTDTLNPYAVNNTSSFSFGVNVYRNDPFFGVEAIQWSQKIDLEQSQDFGVVEYSLDTGSTWANAIGNPYVYNYFGYDSINIDSMPDGTMGFTGTDSIWRNIWLCFDYNWMLSTDSVIIRFTLQTDSSQTNQDGWMLDNFIVHPTIFHTINEIEMENYMEVYPNPASDRINITTKKIDEYHIIEGIDLIDIEGKVVEQWGRSPVKFYIDVSNHPTGLYFLKVKTNKQTETFRVVLNH